MESYKNNSSSFTQWKDTNEVKSEVYIKDINEIWNETTVGYMDMVNKLSYISHITKKNNNKTESSQVTDTYLPLNVRDKLYFLISDMKDVMMTMEKICCAIDDINAKNGSIETSQNDIKKSIVSNSNI